MKKLYYLIVLALILGLVLTGCELLSNISQVPATEQSGITYLTKHTEGHPFTKDLIADGGDLALAIDVGDVLVWNDGVYLYVKYVTEGGWCLTETHLVVATALEDIPQNKKDNPIPGKFPYQCCYDEDEGEWVFKIKNGGAPSATCDADGDTVATLTEILYTIPLNGWEVCTELFIAAHAVVQKQIGTDELGAPIFQTETAWADGLPFTDRGNWATYFTYIIPDIVAVGDSYGGGIVAYILQSGDPGYDPNVQHGLIAALADYSTKIYWHATNGGTTGATETALGTGQANTDKIIALYEAETNAARVCYDYTNVDTGTGVYSDWFLPSKDELNKLWLKEAVIGGFTDYVYWSSSEGGVGSAWYQYFSIIGTQALSIKTQAVWVRAVRAF